MQHRELQTGHMLADVAHVLLFHDTSKQLQNVQYCVCSLFPVLKSCMQLISSIRLRDVCSAVQTGTRQSSLGGPLPKP